MTIVFRKSNVNHVLEYAAPLPSRHRFVALDLLRVAAALGVMFFHFGYQISQEGHTPWRVSGGNIDYPELAPYAQFGWMGVQAFFVISGFVIALSARCGEPAKFLASRILRLVPAVWICAPITAIVALAAADGTPFKIVGRLLKSMFFYPFGSQIDGSYWSLSIEVAFYLVVFCLLLRNRFRYFGHYIYGLAVVSAAFNLAQLADYDVNFSGRWTNLLLLRHGCEFAVGAIIYRLVNDMVKPGACVFLCVAAIGSYAQILESSDPAQYGALLSIWSVYLLLFLAAIAANETLLGLCGFAVLRVLRKAGAATYPLYLIHQLVGAWLIGCLMRAGLNPYPSLAVVTAGMFVLTALIVMAESRLRAAMRPAVMSFCDRLTGGKHRHPPHDHTTAITSH